MGKVKKLFALCFALSIFLLVNYSFATTNMEIKGMVNLNSNNVRIEKLPMTRAVGSLGNNPRGTVTDSLTESDTLDILVFTLTEDKYIAAKLDTANTDYYLQLGVVNFETGDVTALTDYTSNANGILGLWAVPAGDYAILVLSNGTYGDAYSCYINATNPYSELSSIEETSSNLLDIVLKYSDNKIYVNGQYIATTGGVSNTQLDWHRNTEFSYTGGYVNRDHYISNARVKKVHRPITYTSNYVSSNNAVVIELDVDTLFTFFFSSFNSANPDAAVRSFVDISGQLTPRAFTSADINGTTQYLIYDLNTNTAIDYYGIYNYFYNGGGGETATLTFHNN